MPADALGFSAYDVVLFATTALSPPLISFRT